MKKNSILLFSFILLGAFFMKVQAQAPEGFTKGSIVLADGSTITGYIKEAMQKKAALTIIPEAGGKKKNYDGYNLTSAVVGDNRFVCIQGDFFRVICQGELNFLQKQSNAAGKVVYNGTEAIYLAGTAGNTDDYFLHNPAKNTLELVTSKNLDAIVNNSFSNCSAAISKARETGNDIARLKDAVTIYNNRNMP